MIPTPSLSHLSRADYEHVYEPAEDTFILLDALEQDAERLKGICPTICLEIGSGSGCVSTFLSFILGSNAALYLATDINPRATSATYSTGKSNNVDISVLNTSILKGLDLRLRHQVDILVFNPPYVPTYSDELEGAQDSGSIAGAWAGGLDGTELTEVVLQQIKDLLSPRGHFYLVGVTQNKPEEIAARMKADGGLCGEIVLRRRAGGEHLFVLRFTRDEP